MAVWSPKIHHEARVKYVGIVEAIEADIKARVIKPGDRLPAQRQIAQCLNVDLTTVTRAMSEASKRGLVETQPGSGCFIAQTAFSHYNSMLLTAGKQIDLSMNNPPIPAAINIESRIADMLSKLAQEPDRSHLFYQETAGHPADRKTGAAWLKTKIPHINPDAVLIASGAHAALYSVLSHLYHAGVRCIAAPEFCYPGLRSIADHFDFDVVSVAMDEEGIQPAHFAELIRSHSPKALYVTPNIDNPTTATLSQERRQAITELAMKHHISVIEDDPYYAFLDNPLPSFATLAPTLTWHIATLSKCVSPALRVAYVLAPSVDEALSLAEEMRVSNIMAPPLMTAVVSDWIEQDQINVIANAIKQENQQRQFLAASILSSKTIAAPSSPHIWLPLPKGFRALDFAEKASLVGVSVVPSTAFVSTRSQQQAVRLSLGGMANTQELTEGLGLLAELLHSKANRSSSIV